MNAEDITPGVLYGRRISAYSRTVRPVVLLAPADADHLYEAQGLGEALPFFVRATRHRHPQSSGPVVGWPAATTRHSGVDPQVLSHLTLADFEQATTNDDADIAFMLVTSEERIVGQWPVSAEIISRLGS